MWFATDKGISRFDGREFKNYTVLDGIGDNEVFGFYEDKAARLWLFTYNGNSCYLRNDSVFNADNDALLKKMPVIPFMNAMCSIDDTTLYIGYRFGDIIKVSGTTVTKVHEGSGKDELTSIYKAGKLFYAVGAREIYIIDNDKVVATTPLKSPVRSKYYNRELLLGDTRGLKVFRDNKLVWQRDDKDLTVETIIGITNDTSGNIFVSGLEGLFVINRRTGSKSVLFSGQRISNVVQDIYGNYWVASFGSGVYCINKELDNLRFHGSVQKAELYYTPALQFFLKKGDTLYTMDNERLIPEVVRPQFSGNNHLVYNDKRWLFFSKPYAGFLYDKKTGRLKLTDFPYKWIFTDGNDFLDIANYTGTIYNLNIENGKPVARDSFSIHKQIKHARLNAYDNKIYILSEDCLYRYNNASRKLDVIDAALKGKKAVKIICSGSNIILPTATNTLLVYNMDLNFKRTALFTGDIAIYDLIDIDYNKYLVHSNKGYHTMQFRYHPFPSVRFKKMEYPFRSNRLFNIYPVENNLVCNVNGDLYSISKTLVNKEISTPVFYIKKIIANGFNVRGNDIVFHNTTKCNVNVVLAALHFNNADNSYQYRVYDDNKAGQWYRSNGDNFNILIPEHGSYKIELRAITENNMASPSRFISVLLTPPFYYSAWFIIVMILLFVSVLVYAVYLYNKRRRHIFQNKLNYLKLEHRAMNGLLNPHFTFNAINNIQDLVNEQASEKANEYLSVFSKLIRQNMENLQFNLVPVDRELNLIENYIRLQNLRFDNKIELVVNNNLPLRDAINIPPLLIHTFVENAVVHGFVKDKAGFLITIDISISTDDFLIITIRDNGRGFANTSKGYEHLSSKTSMGIEITRKRLEKLSRFYKTTYSLDVTDINDDGETGTEVIIILSAKFTEQVA